MTTPEIGNLLNDVGRLLIDHAASPANTLLLYTEADRAWVSASVFEILADHIAYRWCSRELTEKLLELWEAEQPDRRWAFMYYEVKNGKFDAIFEFEENIDREEDEMDRRRRIIRERYGDRPIQYPPIPQLREEEEG